MQGVQVPALAVVRRALPDYEFLVFACQQRLETTIGSDQVDAGAQAPGHDEIRVLGQEVAKKPDRVGLVTEELASRAGEGF